MLKVRCFFKMNYYIRGAQIPGKRPPCRLHFAQCFLIFVVRQYVTCFHVTPLASKILRFWLDFLKKLYTPDLHFV